MFRSDGSGTKLYFHHLSESGFAQVAGIGGRGQHGEMAHFQLGARPARAMKACRLDVNRVKNSIGYVEYAYAKQNNMSHVQLQNKAGHSVQPSQESFAAAADVDWKSVPGFSLVLTNQPAEATAFSAAATFIW